jgi:hypothetical protein
MKTSSHFALLLVLLVTGNSSSLAHTLDISIRAHSMKVMFGDPIFLEVTIVNKGNDAVLATNPDIYAGSCAFSAQELKTNLRINCSGPEAGSAVVGDPKQIEYLPGVPMKQGWTIFAPYTSEVGNHFWTAAQDNRKVQIWFELALEKKVSLRSDPITVQLQPRDKEEFKAIEKWTPWDKQRGDTNICPINLGVHLNAVNTKQEAKDVASEIKSGELGELLRLIVQLQELADSPDKQETGAAVLIGWLKSQPDIKRQLMSARIAQMYPWLPTQSLHAIKELAESKQ